MEPQRLANNRRALKPQENITDQIQPLPPPRKCPRCDSTNTKFCYYNNYSLSQPRYFCKGCRRYWTHGGTLRNVPVGGGCRKSKRPKTLSSLPPASSSSTNEQITGIDIRSLATSYSPSTTTPAAPVFRSQSFMGLLSAGMHHHNMPNLYSSTTDGGGLISSLGVGGLVMTACNNNMALLQGMNYLQNMKPHQVMSTQRMINVPHQMGNDHHHQQFVGSQIIQQRPLGSWITTRGFVNSKNTGASETLITSTGL